MNRNLTISVDDGVLARARVYARDRGLSIQELLRRYLGSLVGAGSREEIADELLGLMTEFGGRSGGAAPRREDARRDRS